MSWTWSYIYDDSNVKHFFAICSTGFMDGVLATFVTPTKSPN